MPPFIFYSKKQIGLSGQTVSQLSHFIAAWSRDVSFLFSSQLPRIRAISIR